VPLGFLSGGFSSTAGYVPGNEARAACLPRGAGRALERRHTLRDDQVSLGVIRFYPDDSNRICRAVGGKPFGFGLRRLLNGGFPLLPFPDECVTALIPLPLTGHGARKQPRL